MRDWISDYCQQKQGVTQEFKMAWNATLHLVGKKIFVMLGEYKDGRPLLTVKLEPAFSEILRAQFPGDIIPGYYTDKNHWSSLFLDSAVPDDTARAMLDNAYETTFATLTKKMQSQILAQ
ncbi:MAG: MmcQ/YjbR family DNA-binding protein [Eubacteriales bacterium]|jgi:predicted DNA-binding protein (MmcQ/YjbR family)|nr:MmcQ/YjbR family DNA-binding protein [Eubacteriales bacterium]